MAHRDDVTIVKDMGSGHYDVVHGGNPSRWATPSTPPAVTGVALRRHGPPREALPQRGRGDR